LLGAVGALDQLATKEHIFADLPAAIAHARLHIERAGQIAAGNLGA
jgi:hypothetical protein